MIDKETLLREAKSLVEEEDNSSFIGNPEFERGMAEVIARCDECGCTPDTAIEIIQHFHPGLSQETIKKRFYGPWEINREMVISTIHLSERCEAALNRNDRKVYKLIYDSLHTGFRIQAYGAGPLPKTGFKELDKILEFAQNNAIKWVYFDPDGPIYKDEFQVFESDWD